jgi:hypothetical protein
MSISKTWTIQSLVDKSVSVIGSLQADNIGKACSLSNKFLNDYSHDSLYQNHRDNESGWTGFTVYAKTNNTIPSSMLSKVNASTVTSQFQSYLSQLKLTEKDMKGKAVSVRTVQAFFDAIVSFISTRFVIWLNPAGDSFITLYNSGSVSYVTPNFNYNITDYRESLSKADFDTMMDNVALSAFNAITAKRQPFKAVYNSSCSSSCSSSSCSSSSSSSCSSSSCSSSCSTTFIAYMKII